MNLAQLLADYIDRAKSHIYAIFFSWIVMIHLPIIFVALFIDQEILYQSTHQLRNEYIATHFYNFTAWWMWVVYICGTLLFAGVMTWLMIWVLPKTIIKRAYKREITDQYERDQIKLEKEAELESLRAQKAKSQVVVVENEERVFETKNRIEDKEQTAWRRDYAEFKNSIYFKDFDILIEAIYEHAGQSKADWDEYGSRSYQFQVNPGLLAYADSLDVIKIIARKNDIVNFEFTEKGKYFLRNYRRNRK